MALNVYITDTTTQQTRLSVMDIEWTGPFVWSEGNFACDCNRSDFFAQAGGEDEDDESPCSHGRFKVRVQQGNTLLYAD